MPKTKDSALAIVRDLAKQIVGVDTTTGPYLIAFRPDQNRVGKLVLRARALRKKSKKGGRK